MDDDDDGDVEDPSLQVEKRWHAVFDVVCLVSQVSVINQRYLRCRLLVAF